MPEQPIIVHGLSLSYFTGKMEAYLRAKGIPYRFAEMNMASFRRTARATGIAQMPQLEMPDGTWLTDTTRIIRHFESMGAEPALSPRDPATHFISLLLEDYGDEWLWRPALYYRWHFPDDMTLMSAAIARTMMRDLKLPFWLRRRLILRRQRRVYLSQDGVTKETAPQIEALYLETLDALEAVFVLRPFLMGQRPVEADFGFFGSMFRHFASDPTPAAIMRTRAPHVLAWVARMWALTPVDFAGAPLPAAVPADLAPILREACAAYLPYLAANDEALKRGDRHVSYAVEGVGWRVPVSPYRAHCLAALRDAYAALGAEARSRVDAALGGPQEILNAPAVYTASMPAAPAKPVDRQWRAARG
ncbi:MAG: glutathione S-transferase N-terminal domain-containing protein [Parvibaculum sp.]|nr:glutathione S-transferase N-terminal domain-containing protein [Parvibaculum sp.]